MNRDHGFSLLEVCLAVFLAAISLIIVVPCCSRTITFQNLIYTRQALLLNLRTAQAAAQATGEYWNVRFAPFKPEYWVLDGSNQQLFASFLPGVDYKTGYLQLQSNNVIYDVSGNGQVAGSIKLCTGLDEADINLYMGSGLVSGSGGGL